MAWTTRPVSQPQRIEFPLRLSFRAAAYAAVASAIFASIGVGYAGPSLASEADSVPAVSYTQHGETILAVDTLGLNDLPETDSASPEVDLNMPAAVHAVAPALPATVLDDESVEADREQRSLDELVAEFASTTTPDAETECLARGVYYEAKGESLTGQLTVAEVIINRARSGRFPSTLCGVLRQRGQFSFVRGGHIPQPPVGARHWPTAVAIAQIAMQDLADGAAPRALFFHARHVRPGWRLTRVATVGNHIFYR